MEKSFFFRYICRVARCIAVALDCLRFERHMRAHLGVSVSMHDPSEQKDSICLLALSFSKCVPSLFDVKLRADYDDSFRCRIHLSKQTALVFWFCSSPSWHFWLAAGEPLRAGASAPGSPRSRGCLSLSWRSRAFGSSRHFARP